MTFPIQVSFRDVAIHPPLEELAQAQADKLSRYFDRITRGRLVIEHDGAHPPRYHVKLELTLPAHKAIVVQRGPELDIEHSIREAFEAARRQVQDVSRKLRGDVKAHAPEVD